jgi:predicted nucleic acid-binding Zn ribbon protein
MPTYVYETITQNEAEVPECFEIRQSMKDPALTHHPESGKPVRRVILAGNVLTKSNSGSSSTGRCGCGTSGCC